MIESSQLQVLMALSESSSLSQAAEVLHITQSAVSQNLKSLESKVGFAVVARQGKKVVLTPSGRRLAKLGKNYFKKLDDAITDILQDQNIIAGKLRVGTLFGIGKSWIASRMIEFSSHFPDMAIDVKMDFPEKLLKSFENHDLDCLILPDKLIPAHSEHLILHNEYSTLVYPDNNKYNITTETSLKELCEKPLIFFEERDPLFYQWCKEKHGTVPRNIKPRIIVNAFGQMLQAVNEGLGIAVVPTHVFRRSFFKNKVKTLGKEFDIQSSEFHFVYHNDDKESLKIKTLYEFLHKEVDKLDL
jgi:DNA-binding transcriptional LysR family regulator